MNSRQHTEQPLEVAGTSTPKAAKKERKLLRKIEEIEADPTLTKKQKKAQKPKKVKRPKKVVQKEAPGPKKKITKY